MREWLNAGFLVAADAADVQNTLQCVARGDAVSDADS
jgi:hypothetical protein